MFNDLRDKNNLNTWVSFAFALCCAAVTVGCMFFSNLSNIFAINYEEGDKLFTHFTFIFYHGFDDTSALVHLAIDLYFLIAIGALLEKIIGALRFLIYTAICILAYGLVIREFHIYAPAATGLIWCYTPAIIFVLLEGRRIKTRSAYEEYYGFLRLNVLTILTVLPILTIFLQFYLQQNITFLSAAKNGLIPFIFNLALGVILTYFLRPHIKSRLKSFNRKKKFEPTAIDQLARWGGLAFPAYIVLVLYLYKTISL